MKEKKKDYKIHGLIIAALLLTAAYFWGPGMRQTRAMDEAKLWLTENEAVISSTLKGTNLKPVIKTNLKILILGEVNSTEKKEEIIKKLKKLEPPIPFQLNIYVTKKAEQKDGE